MRHRKLAATEQSFVDRVRELEERIFPYQLFEKNLNFMKSDGRHFWHFRPSHHIATGLVTEEDIELLSQPGKRLLSVGAHPGFLEQTLVAFGVPAENILLSDNDPAVSFCCDSIQAVIFDMLEKWPQIGTFDRIIFPESLCIAISDNMREKGIVSDATNIKAGIYEHDAVEATLLADILRQALRRLQPGGVIRCNGPMSHPNVVKATSARLTHEGYGHTMDYHRFFLSVTPLNRE